MMPPRTPDSPIGIFDSGFGGLSVYREVRQMLPTEDVIYVADGAYVPYGSRTPEEIIERSDRIARYLIDRGVKLVIVACNTASAYAIDVLRERYPAIPFIGLEPAVKPAVAQTITGQIGVLATPRTVSGERLHRLIERWAGGVTVNRVAGEGMVELVEAGVLEGPAVDSVIRPLLDQMLKVRCDVIVLGCTHYPFLRRPIMEYVGADVRVIDSGVAIARRALSLLQSSGVRREGGEAGSFRLLTTAPPEETSRVATALLGREITAEQVLP
jgi:glutamate racemase